MDYGDSKRSKDLWRRPESPRFVSLSAAAGALIYEGFFALWAWWMTCDLLACADGRVILGQFGPIQAPRPRRPGLSCVGESESRCEGDLGVGHRGPGTCQAA